jgi:hypothetical protein
MRQEQLPIPKHQLHGWTHFVGLYAAEHVAATEFVIGRKEVWRRREVSAGRRSREREAAIEEYQAQQALSEGEPVEDHSVLSKVLRGIALAALVITLALAARVMFWSPDASVYEANRDF